jgi:hypothetical protein
VQNNNEEKLKCLHLLQVVSSILQLLVAGLGQDQSKHSAKKMWDQSLDQSKHYANKMWGKKIIVFFLRKRKGIFAFHIIEKIEVVTRLLR